MIDFSPKLCWKETSSITCSRDETGAVAISSKMKLVRIRMHEPAACSTNMVLRPISSSYRTTTGFMKSVCGPSVQVFLITSLLKSSWVNGKLRVPQGKRFAFHCLCVLVLLFLPRSGAEVDSSEELRKTPTLFLIPGKWFVLLSKINKFGATRVKQFSSCFSSGNPISLSTHTRRLPIITTSCPDCSSIGIVIWRDQFFQG